MKLTFRANEENDLTRRDDEGLGMRVYPNSKNVMDFAEHISRFLAKPFRTELRGLGWQVGMDGWVELPRMIDAVYQFDLSLLMLDSDWPDKMKLSLPEAEPQLAFGFNFRCQDFSDFPPTEAVSQLHRLPPLHLAVSNFSLG